MPKKRKKDEIQENKKIESLKVIKNSFKSIVKDEILIEKLVNGEKVNIPLIYERIEDAMLRTNQIVIFTYQFIKLYLIYLYDNNEEIPIIDHKFIKNVMDVLSTRDLRGRRKIQDDSALNDFYENHFKIEKVSKKGLSQILNYTSISMQTAYSNTIIQTLKKVICKYVYCIVKNENIKELSEIKNKKKLKELKKSIKEKSNFIVNSIVENKLVDIPDIFKDLINLLPSEISKENHLYNVSICPEKYIYPMIFMNRKLEDLNIKTYSFLPLRNNIIPKYIDIDTKVLIEITDIENKGELLKDIKNNKLAIWNKFFKINNKFFSKKNYNFNFHIQTDLIGVSAIFSKLVNEKEKEDIKYITDIDKENLEILRKEYNFVYCDPGKKQLLFMMDDNQDFLRYTIHQRRQETKSKKFSIILEKLKSENKINELSNELTKVNSKSFYLEKFKDFIKVKNEINKKLSFFYVENMIHRKLNFRKYTLKQKTEEKLINRINERYTKGERKPLFIFGNWNITKQMSNFVPTPNIHLRNKISKNFKMLLLDEFRTSCLDYKSNERVINMKDKTTNKKIHQVLILTENNRNLGCINRDKNAVRNFKSLTDNYILTGEIKERFKRGFVSAVSLERANP